MDESSTSRPFQFSGFDSPNYTQVPDVVFDELLSELSESELKVLLYIIRRTFGFKRESDSISLRQMTDGITTRDGRRLDRGAGISKTSAVRGIKGLIDKGIIIAVRRRSDERGDEATTYQLRFRDGDAHALSETDTIVEPPLSKFETPPPLKLDTPPVPNVNTPVAQIWTHNKQKNKKEERDLSKGPSMVDRELVERFIRDYALEFLDEAPLSSSVARAAGLWERADVDQATFLGAMQEARRRTQRYTGVVLKKRPDGRKNKMPYFFATLERLLGEGVAGEIANHEIS